jgi:hypothetical protein
LQARVVGKSVSPAPIAAVENDEDSNSISISER